MIGKGQYPHPHGVGLSQAEEFYLSAARKTGSATSDNTSSFMRLTFFGYCAIKIHKCS